MASPGKPAGFTTDTFASSLSYPSNLTNVNGTLYFTNGSIKEQQLWKTDSTGNAVLVKDINSGDDLFEIQSLTNVDGTTYFTAYDAIAGNELRKIDNNGNVVLVKDINAGDDSSYTGEFTNINGTLYFTALDATRRELWKIDTASNAVRVKYINSDVELSSPSNLTNVEGTIYFTTESLTKGEQLWKIDNTGDAVLVKNLSSATESSWSYSFTNVDGNLYFVTNKLITIRVDNGNNIPGNGQELWKIDSTGNSVLVKTNPINEQSSLSNLTNVNGTLYFTARNYTNGNGEELWRINSFGNAVLVKDINLGTDFSQQSYLTNVNGTLYFTASSSTNGRELWKIDSTGSPVLVKDINVDTDYSYQQSYLTNINGTLYFTASNSNNGKELWKIDSTGNVILVRDLNVGNVYSFQPYLTNVNGTLYFIDNDTTNGQELWRIDTTGNVVLVKDINPGTDSSAPSTLTNVNGALYFTAYDATTGRELWKIDDTGNAVLVKDINPVSTSSDPIYSRFVDYGNSGLLSESGGTGVVLTPDLFNRNMLETTSAIQGVSIQAVSQKSTNKVNEIGFFNVDDRDAKIDGIKPGEAGYIKAAIERSKSILTTLGGDFFNTEKQEIGLDPNKIYQFFEIENGSLSDVKQQLNRGEIPTNIRLSNLDANGYSSIKITGNSIQSGYDISINNDELVLKVTKLDGLLSNRPIGSESQGKIEGRIIDLTNYGDRSLTVDITTKSDAVYQSQIGFYTVKDTLGTIELADGRTVKPGDVNYAMVAVKNAIANAGLQANRIDSKTNQPIAGGLIYAPVVVAQGTLNDFVNNPSNNMHAYFNYVKGNADKVDHFRQIGANTFGVEDMYGGGDRDFNDLVIQMNIKTV